MKESYDAVMLHGYMFKNNGQDSQSPAWLRNHMQTTAGAELYRSGVAKKLFLPSGHYWGTDKPTNSELMRKDLIGKGVPEEAIIMRPLALDTGTEVDLFTEEARVQGWENRASVSNATHTQRVRQNYTEKGIFDADNIKAESVLYSIEHNGRNPYRDFVKRFSNSWPEKVFGFREKIVRAAIKLHMEKTLKRLSQFPIIQRLKAVFDS